jgi:hypothetical protein
MPPDPEKSRRTPAQSVEYQPGTSQQGQNGGPENAQAGQEGNERHSVETETESKEDSV